jgi:sortase B
LISRQEWRILESKVKLREADEVSTKLRKALTLVLLAVFLVSSGYVAWKLLDYQKGAQDYDDARETARIPTAQLHSDRPDAKPEGALYDPFEALGALDLGALQSVNQEVVGWVEIPNTAVSYPILKAQNNEYYLNHTWKKDVSSVGAIFMDKQNDPEFGDFHTLLYGHNMKNGSMFGCLRSYRSADYWKSHPAVYVVDKNGVHQYDIFAAYEVGVQEIVYRGDVEQSGLQKQFLDFAARRSVISTGIAPQKDDQILTLSTCTGRGHATRWIIQAVRNDEAQAVSQMTEELPDEAAAG